MLKLSLKFSDGGSEEYRSFKSITLQKSISVPADSLSVILPFFVEKEACEIRLFDDENLIFEGIADEQKVVFSEDICTCFEARSMTALLIDNEAEPEIFTNPSSALILNRYAKPCGLLKSEFPSKALSGVLGVYKGTSCYSVLREFCQRVYGELPFVRDGVLCLQNKKNEEILFSLEGEGVHCSEIERNYSRYSLLSKMLVKTRSDGVYDTSVEDKESVRSGVYRQRYLDLSSLAAVSLEKAENLIKKGRQNALEIHVKTPVRITEITGEPARVRAGDREYKNLLVTDLLYTFRNNKEQTKITLCVREE